MKLRRVYIPLVLLASALFIQTANDLTAVLGVSGQDSKVILSEKETKEQLKQTLQERLELHQEEADKIGEQLNADLKELQRKKDRLAKKASESENDNKEFYDKQISLLDDQYHVIKQTLTLLNTIKSLLIEHIKLVNAYLKDPDLVAFKKELTGKKGLYTFDDLKVLHQARVTKEEEIEALNAKDKVFQVEYETRKRSLGLVEKEHRELLEQREKIEKESDELLLQQSLAAWEQERQLYEDKIRLYRLRVQEQKEALALNRTHQFLSERELQSIEKMLKQVKGKVFISQNDLGQMQEGIEKKRRIALSSKNEYDQKMERVDDVLRVAQNELAEKATEADIKLGQLLDSWRLEPKKVAQSFIQVATIGALNARVKMLSDQKDLLRAQISAEDEIIQSAENLAEVQKTFYKMRTASEEEIAKEIKRYERTIKGLKADIYSYQVQISADEAEIKSMYNALDNLDGFQKNLEEHKELFEGNIAHYELCTRVINQAREVIHKRIDLVMQEKNLYAENIVRLERSLRLAEFALSELSSITMWYRSESAISWEGIRDAPLDVVRFLTELSNITHSFNLNSMFGGAGAPSSKKNIFLLVMQLLLWFILSALAGNYVPSLEQWFVAVSGMQIGFMRWLLLLAASVSGFVVRYHWTVTFVLSICLTVTFFVDVHTQVLVLYNLAAIPVLLYLSDRLLRYVFSFNTAYSYALFNKEVAPRVARVVRVLTFSTIIFWFFGKAFVLSNYPQSELPNILLALNFIILQIALISLISKDQILMLIPSTGRLSSLVRYFVDRYYALIFLAVIAVIVMSNPYVGFGQLVLVLMRKILISAALVSVLVWIHNYIKESIAKWFFAELEDTSRERFANAKSWYGLFVILLFSIALFFGAVLLAKIWNWPEQLVVLSKWSDVEQLLKAPLSEYAERISVWTFLTLGFYIMLGLFVSMAFSRFVLKRIFEILYVDEGVQNTVESIFHYILLLIAFVLGFNAVGLGSFVWWLLTAFVFSLGFVIKDPVLDFFAYFIILVQRPVKVGDFVQLDQELSGVVRRITPRAVVLRSKNSKSIIIPNSVIISRPLTNWNYTRGFIAFNDIFVTVSYSSNPFKAREIMHKILTENEYILRNPRPIVWMKDFRPDGYQFTVRGYINSNYTLDQWDIASDIRVEIVRVFKQAGVKLAIPTRFVVKPSDSHSHVEEQNTLACKLCKSTKKDTAT